jgi:hypothetical protein
VSVGYQRPTLKLVFTDPEMDGLEVRARRLSIGELLHITSLASDENAGTDDMLAALAAALLSWNLEDADGAPVPLTADGLKGQDYLLLEEIKKALIEASWAVPPPLSTPSTDGTPALEASIPMEVS